MRDSTIHVQVFSWAIHDESIHWLEHTVSLKIWFILRPKRVRDILLKEYFVQVLFYSLHLRNLC